MSDQVTSLTYYVYYLMCDFILTPSPTFRDNVTEYDRFFRNCAFVLSLNVSYCSI